MSVHPLWMTLAWVSSGCCSRCKNDCLHGHTPLGRPVQGARMPMSRGSPTLMTVSRGPHLIRKVVSRGLERMSMGLGMSRGKCTGV